MNYVMRRMCPPFLDHVRLESRLLSPRRTYIPLIGVSSLAPQIYWGLRVGPIGLKASVTVAGLIEATVDALGPRASPGAGLASMPAGSADMRPIGPGVRDAVLRQLGFFETDPDVKVLAITKALEEIDVMGGWSLMQCPHRLLCPSTLAPIIGFQICRPRKLGPFRLYF